MPEKFKIYSEFIKDLSSETKDLETYLYVKEYLKNYNLNIEITSKPLKKRKNVTLIKVTKQRKKIN